MPVPVPSLGSPGQGPARAAHPAPAPRRPCPAPLPWVCRAPPLCRPRAAPHHGDVSRGARGAGALGSGRAGPPEASSYCFAHCTPACHPATLRCAAHCHLPPHAPSQQELKAAGVNYQIERWPALDRQRKPKRHKGRVGMGLGGWKLRVMASRLWWCSRPLACPQCQCQCRALPEAPPCTPPPVAGRPTRRRCTAPSCSSAWRGWRARRAPASASRPARACGCAWRARASGRGWPGPSACASAGTVVTCFSLIGRVSLGRARAPGGGAPGRLPAPGGGAGQQRCGLIVPISSPALRPLAPSTRSPPSPRHAAGALLRRAFQVSSSTRMPCQLRWRPRCRLRPARMWPAGCRLTALLPVPASCPAPQHVGAARGRGATARGRGGARGAAAPRGAPTE